MIKVQNKKSTKDLKNNILEILKTKQNANEFTEFVKYLSSRTFSTDRFDISAVATEKYGNNTPFWLEEIKKDLHGNNDVEYTRKYLLDLEDVVDKAPLVRIELCFSPSDKFIKEIYILLGKLKITGIEDSGFIIDLNIDSSIKGGAILHVGGKYIDLSIKNLLASYLETNDVIKRYL